MLEKACPTFPCRDMDQTTAFYAKFGFKVANRYENEGYLLLHHGDVELHFFRDSDHDPAASDFSAYLRLDDPDGLAETLAREGVPTDGIPRYHPAEDKDWGMREMAIIDPDGNLLRAGKELH
jgi:catechol 2,3-dioxygenase-like lactoylglutathione lyase family enzyme